MRNDTARRNTEGTIKCENLTFRYFENSKRNILDDLSLEFPKGKVTVILGSSGCGKSTLAAVMCGLYPENGGFLEKGSVFIDDKDILSLPFGERCRFITAMFQNPDLQFCMSDLKSEMYFCLENLKVPMEKMDGIIEQTAEKYGVSGLLFKPFALLSGGEKQKAALTCLILLDPEVMVLDEPFANLDPPSTAQYISLLKKKTDEESLTVIAIDHKASNWLGTADYFLLLDEKCRPASAGLIKADELKGKAELLKELGIENPYEPVKLKAQIYHGKESAFEFASASVFHDKKHKNKNPQLKDVLLKANKGEIIACLGPSGSGKTTFLLTLLGQKSYEGSIKVHSKELSGLKKKELFSAIGIVFQNPSIQFVTTSVQKEIESSLKMWTDADDAEIEKKATELLESYDLRHYRKFSPFMLSQGQQRRLAVLAMMAGDQDILLLDEPTYGQDERTTKVVMEQAAQRADEGTTVIFTTHDRALACTWADRVWYFENGHISEKSKEEVLDMTIRPQEPGA